MITVEYIQKVSELTKALSEGLEAQQEILEGLKESLEAYEEFMTQWIKEMRNE